MADIFTPAERDRIWETALRQALERQQPAPEPPPAPEDTPPDDPLFQVAVDIYCAIRTVAHHEALNLRKGPR